MLAHDKDGFLIGPPAEIGSDTYAQALAIWRDIKGDTAAIRSSLSRRASEATCTGTAAKATVATPARRQSGLSLVQIERVAAGVVQGLDKGARVRAAKPRSGSMVAEAAVAASTSAKKVVAAKLAASAVKAATPERGAGGRFVSKGGSPGEKRKNKRNGDDEDMPGFLSRAAESLSGAADKISTAASENEQLDPAIAAAKEVGDVISPIVKTTWGVGKGFIGLFKRDKDGKDKAIPWYRRIWGELRAINKKSGGGEGGGLLSGLLPSLGGLLGKIPGIGAIGKLMGGIGGGRGLLRFAARAALPLAGIASAFKSFQTSTEEYAQRMGLTSGESLAKDLGIRFVGTLGDLGNTITFGLAGKLGEIMSPAMNDFVDRSVKAWTDTTTWFKEKWEGFKNLTNQTIDKAKDVGSRAVDTVRDKAKSGVDFFRQESKGLSVGKFTTEEQASIIAARQSGEKFRGGLGLSEDTKKIVTDAAAKHGVDPQAMLAMAKIESNGNAYAVSPTGATGLFQFTSGTSKRYGVKNRFDAAENADAAARYMLDNKKALEAAGITPTAENLYLAHQQGVGGAIQIIKASQGNGTVSAPVTKNMGLNYGNMSASEYVSANRKKVIAASANAASPAMAAMPSASARAVTAAPSVARVPSAAQSPESMTPPPAPQPPPTRIGTNGQGDKPIVVNVPKEVGQNVGDRAIAQIVTGGLGGYALSR